MKKIVNLKVIFFLATMLFMGSCNEDIMNFKDKNSYSYSTFFTTPQQIEMGVNAAYASIYFNNMFGFMWPEMFDALGNDFEPGPSGINEPYILDMLEYKYKNVSNPSLSYGNPVEGYWRMLYKLIMRSNLVIDKAGVYITEKGEDPLVERCLGEAYFLRGWAYSQLAFYWGRVPLRTQYDQGGNEDTPRSATVEEVWKIAENDYLKAIEYLPEASTYTPEQLGRASKGSAIGFLGKLYLYNKKYNEAFEQFNKLDGVYKLLPANKWMDNGGETNENNEESIFEFQFEYFKEGGIYGSFTPDPEATEGQPNVNNGHAMLYSWKIGGVDAWDNWRFSKLRVRDFSYKDEAGTTVIDPRAAMSFYSSKGGYGDPTYCDQCPEGILNYPYTGDIYYFKKNNNREVKLTEGTLESGNNVRLMRYADVLLMQAECKIETGDIATGLIYINKVRARAGAFEYKKNYSKTEAFDLLKRERTLELVGEQHRFNDLKRWGILKETLDPEHMELIGRTVFEEKYYMFPIPQIEIDTNLKLGEVKDGWN